MQTTAQYIAVPLVSLAVRAILTPHHRCDVGCGDEMVVGEVALWVVVILVFVKPFAHIRVKTVVAYTMGLVGATFRFSRAPITFIA